MTRIVGRMRSLPLLVCLVLVTAAACSRTAKKTEVPLAKKLGAPLGQLPEDVEPLHYTLNLEIVPERQRFSGTAAIQVRMAEASTVIWLHGQDLQVQSASLNVGGDAISAVWQQVSEDGVARIVLEREAPAGEATIHIAYTAPFDTQLKGLYRVESGGEAYAFTQFESINARLAFPCFDEPRFKTPFDVTLTVNEADVAAANTPIEEEAPTDDGQKVVRYATTKALPTYLIAWAVGPLDVVKARSIRPNKIRSRRVPFRGLAAKGQGPRLKYALEHTPAMLKALEEYFGIEYPYEKLDIVAVPDFGSGAMENVGLITFRETLLLVDPENSSESQRRAFAYVMAHELAHMWFGNLVTMPWWDDIWLNEAFATWMGNKAVVKLYPHYRVELSSLHQAHRAMQFDSLVSARQIRQPIKSNHDIRNAFDPITYQKGGAVLEMFEHWLGYNTFRTGIRRYLKKHAWTTATAGDLLAALDDASQKDVSSPFRTFLFQPGVPMIDTRLDCADGAAFLEVSQSRYFPIGSSGSRDQSWQLPICLRTSVERTCQLVSEKRARIPLKSCPTWYAPNDQGAGYFRFGMPQADLEALRSNGFRELSPRTRIAVVDSLAAAFAANAQSAEDVFAWFEVLSSDRLRQVATMPMDLIEFARDYTADDALREKIDTFSRQLYTKLRQKLGWRSGSYDHGETRLLRESVLGFLALSVNDPEVRKRATEVGRAYVGFGTDGKIHSDAIDPQLAGMALSVAAQETGEAFFDHLVNLLGTSEDAVIRSRVLGALGRVRDPALASRALDLTLDKRVRVNEISRILYGQFGQRETREVAWTWLKEHIEQYIERFGARQVGRTPWYTSSFCSQERAKEVEEFFSPRVEELSGGPRNLAGALEEIRLCAARSAAQADSIRRFFDAK